MKIEVILTNTTPYHSSSTVSRRVNLEGKTPKGNESDFPCTCTRTMPVIVDMEDGEPRREYAYIMPANSMRHALREAILSLIMDKFRGKYTLPVGAYVAAHAGSSSGNPDGVMSTYDEMRAVSRHAFLGLFGGGPRMIEGRLQVGNAVSMTKDTAAIVADREEFITSIHKNDLMAVSFNRRVDPVSCMSVDDEDLVENAVESLTRWSDDVASRTRNKNNDDDKDNTRGINSFSAHEWVIPGVNWSWEIGTRSSTTKEQIGAILSGLQGIHGANLGGMSRLDYGKVKIRSIRIDGQEVWSGSDFVETDLVFEAMDAWNEGIESMTADDFILFAESRKPAKEEKAKGKPKPEGK